MSDNTTQIAVANLPLQAAQVHYADVDIDISRNTIRQVDSPKELFRTGTTKEGVPTYDFNTVVGAIYSKGGLTAILGAPVVVPLTKAEQDEAVKRRQALLDEEGKSSTDQKVELKESDGDGKVTTEKLSLSASDRLATLKELWLNAKGQVKAPKYGVIARFRRMQALLTAITIAARKGKPINFTKVDVLIGDGLTHEQEKKINALENIGTDEGRLVPTVIQKIKGAAAVIDLARERTPGVRITPLLENEMGYKHGTAGKMAACALFHLNWPKLGLVEKLETKPEDGGIAFGKIKQNSALKEVQLITDLKGAQEWIDAQIKATNEGNAKKAMEKKDIQGLKGWGVAPLTAMVQAYENDDTAPLLPYKHHAEQISLLSALILKGPVDSEIDNIEDVVKAVAVAYAAAVDIELATLIS